MQSSFTVSAYSENWQKFSQQSEKNAADVEQSKIQKTVFALPVHPEKYQNAHTGTGKQSGQH